MLADSVKNNPLSSADSCALYYFPEIPGHMAKGNVPASTCGHFVGGALDRDGDGASAGETPQDSQKVRERIKEAFDKGVAQGRDEAVCAQKETVDKATAALKTALEEIGRLRKQDVERMETETVRLALAISRKIIGNETEHGQMIGHVVKTAMQKVVDPRNLTLKLNPKDIDTVKGFTHELLPADETGSVLHLEADETILRGGCIIETQLGDIDARIDQQIAIVESLLAAELPRHFVER